MVRLLLSMPAARRTAPSILRFPLLLAALLTVFLLGVPAYGQVAVPLDEAPAASLEEQQETAYDDELSRRLHGLEAFADGYMASYLEQSGVVGGTLSVVRGDELLLARGYGFSDLETRQPVDPERTLFRIGSISKTFVWTAIMQQVVAGKLDLDADINAYLPGFQVPEKYDEPITLRHLLSHTSGLDEFVLGLFATDATAMRPLADLLADELPRRIRPPGEVASYSNHGSALAMYTVEAITGVDWNDYIDQEILDPLELRYATFRQPVQQSLVDRVSKGYSSGAGPTEEGFEFVPLGSIGGASVSAVDMARYMSMHLGGGEVGGVRILAEQGAELLQKPIFTPYDGAPAMLHGFYEMNRNGVRIYGHGGDTLWFHSQMALFPDHDLGVFLSFNTDVGNPAAFIDAFVEEYFPAEPEIEVADVDVGRFAGFYRMIRYSHSDMTKIMALMGTMKIESEDGALVLHGQQTTRYLPIAPLVFQEENGFATLGFREQDGRIVNAFISQAPMMALEPAPALQRPGVQAVILLAALALFVLTVLSWPIGAILRLWYGVRLDEEDRIGFVNRLSLWLMCGSLVAGLVAAAMAMSNPNDVVFGNSPGLGWHQTLTWIGVLLGLLTLGLCVRVWRGGSGRVLSRVAYTVVVLGFLVYLWQHQMWKLLSLPF